jgi:hypothetical protein
MTIDTVLLPAILPDDILREILVLAVDSAESDGLAEKFQCAIRLSQVCRRWRTVALAIPSI